MIIGTAKEQDTQETRTAITPETAKKLINQGHIVVLESGIGKKSFFKDSEYRASGVKFATREDIYKKSQIILQINPINDELLKKLSAKQLFVSNFSNIDTNQIHSNSTIIQLEKVPRSSIAQSIDILSSQHTIRGYMGALYALYHSPEIAPQMITAASTIKASSTLVIGTSICGLQASAVFKRMGCKVTIADSNENNKELASSVGATFAHIKNKEDIYFIIKNKNFIFSAVSPTHSNIPTIITKDMLPELQNNSVIIDSTTKNIAIKNNDTSPKNFYFHRNTNFERLAPITASELWANNMLNLINSIIIDNKINLSANHISPMILKRSQ